MKTEIAVFGRPIKVPPFVDPAPALRARDVLRRVIDGLQPAQSGGEHPVLTPNEAVELLQQAMADVNSLLPDIEAGQCFTSKMLQNSVMVKVKDTIENLAHEKSEDDKKASPELQRVAGQVVYDYLERTIELNRAAVLARRAGVDTASLKLKDTPSSPEPSPPPGAASYRCVMEVTKKFYSETDATKRMILQLERVTHDTQTKKRQRPDKD
jgi:hypothetical protein